MDINELFRQLEKELKHGNYTREEKMAIIKNVGDIYQKQLDKELSQTLAKQYTGAALEIGSAALPVSGVAGQIAKKIVPAAITKTMGRKLSQDIATSTIGGAIDSAVYGAGRGLVEDENILKTAAQDALSGAAIGGALGSVTGKIANDARAAETKGINQMRKYWGIPFRKASGDPKKAIDTLMENQKGFVPNVYDKKGVGKFDMVYGKPKRKRGYGLGHIDVKRKSEGIDTIEFFNDLPSHIENGDIKHSEFQPNLVFIEDGNNTTIIKKNFDNEKRNWLLTSYDDMPKHIPNNTSRTPDIARDYVGMTPPTYSDSYVKNSKLSNFNSKIKNKIAEYIQNNNLPERLNPKATVGIQAAIDNFENNDFNISQQYPKKETLEVQKPFELRIEKQKMPDGEIVDIDTPTGYAVPINGFRQRNKDLTGYKNPLNGDNRIYTAEDIGDMPHKEFGKLEKIIDAQINSIGIPRKKDLGAFGGGAIYIAPYTRADGVKIRGHYRALRHL